MYRRSYRRTWQGVIRRLKHSIFSRAVRCIIRFKNVLTDEKRRSMLRGLYKSLAKLTDLTFSLSTAILALDQDWIRLSLPNVQSAY